MRKSGSIRSLEKSVVSPLMAVAVNLILIYIIYTLCRIEFLYENYDFFNTVVVENRLWSIFKGGLALDTPGIFYTNALWILMMLLPLHLKERSGYYKVCKWIFIIINSLAIIVNLADSVYFSFTMKRTTADVLAEFNNENNLGKIALVETGRHWYLLVMALVLIAGMWKLYVSPAMDIRRQPLLRYYVLSVGALIVAAVTTIGGIRGGFLNHWWQYLAAMPLAYIAWRLWKIRGKKKKVIAVVCGVISLILLVTAPVGGWRHRDIRPVSLSSASAYTRQPIETALVLNTPFSLIRSIGKTVFYDPGFYTDKAAMEAIYSPIHGERPDSVSRMMRKNVVIIIIESFGKDYVGGLNGDIPGFVSRTPFTDSLINHAAVWRHSFSNGRKSIDGMPSVLASIPMFIKPFVLTPKALNRIDGIPAHLNGKGYETAFFHGARTGSMGFDSFAAGIGFSNYYGREDYVSDSRFGGDKDFDGYWAIWDEPFLQYFATKLTDMHQPFMAAIFTASSHHPFNIPEKYKEVYKEEEIPIQKCIRYTDNALRRFFETARKQPWFANTIFVITADHSNESVHPEYKSAIGGFEVPIIIYDPSGRFTPGMREGTAQQIDIMPTILDYLCYDHPYLSFGKSLSPVSEEQDSLTEEGMGDWAVNYLNGIYQYVKGDYVLEFDGKHTIGIYTLDDRLMQKNLHGLTPEIKKREARMESELQAIIQTYMDRMNADKLFIQQ